MTQVNLKKSVCVCAYVCVCVRERELVWCGVLCQRERERVCVWRGVSERERLKGKIIISAYMLFPCCILLFFFVFFFVMDTSLSIPCAQQLNSTRREGGGRSLSTDILVNSGHYEKNTGQRAFVTLVISAT